MYNDKDGQIDRIEFTSIIVDNPQEWLLGFSTSPTHIHYISWHLYVFEEFPRLLQICKMLVTLGNLMTDRFLPELKIIHKSGFFEFCLFTFLKIFFSYPYIIWHLLSCCRISQILFFVQVLVFGQDLPSKRPLMMIVLLLNTIFFNY